MFDYGAKGNQEHYGQRKPPVYNTSNIPTSIPLVLITGGQVAVFEAFGA